jgi:hypothetical protein
MALKVTAVPLGVDGAAGVMLIPVSTAVVTDKVAADEVMPLAEAVILALPCPTPVARPELLIVATPVFADAQATWLVISRVVPSV